MVQVVKGQNQANFYSPSRIVNGESDVENQGEGEEHLAPEGAVQSEHGFRIFLRF